MSQSEIWNSSLDEFPICKRSSPLGKNTPLFAPSPTHWGVPNWHLGHFWSRWGNSSPEGWSLIHVDLVTENGGFMVFGAVFGAWKYDKIWLISPRYGHFHRETDSQKLGSNIVSRINQNLDKSGGRWIIMDHVYPKKSSKHPNTWFHCTFVGDAFGVQTSIQRVWGEHGIICLGLVPCLIYHMLTFSRTTRSSSICNPNQKWQAIATIFDTPKTNPGYMHWISSCYFILDLGAFIGTI